MSCVLIPFVGQNKNNDKKSADLIHYLLVHQW